MVEYSDEIQCKRICEIASAEVKKYNAEKGLALQVTSYWNYPGTKNPTYVSVIRKKERKDKLLERLRKFFEMDNLGFRGYESLIDIATFRTIRVTVNNLEYEVLAKEIESKLKLI